ncbi:NAD(P)-binding protein [Byssothecium circinans]|uniref:NAD(P)-binding protein n=1 Tax=Byssothecium circinans TaxID=147558 RepID=A0A6A5TGT3_9PLEO|nr:NAD(P)-binding protein [Byssothecium circinans]
MPKLAFPCVIEDMRTIANDPNVDIVAVSVKVPEHYALVKPALEAGKDVFVEWPLARNLPEVEELVALAKAKGVRTMVGLQARQSPPVVKAREIVKSGKLGTLLNSTMYGHGMMFGPQSTESHAYGLELEVGGNLVSVPLTHAVDALAFVLGEFESVTATLGNLRPVISIIDAQGKELRKVKKTAHDQVSVTGALADGGAVVNVTYSGGFSRTGRDFHWEVNGTEGSLVLEGSSGHLQMFHPTLKLILGDGETKTVEEVEVELEGRDRTLKGDFGYNVGKAWDGFAGANNASVVGFDHALVRHRMIDAIYRSAEKGTREKYI